MAMQVTSLNASAQLGLHRSVGAYARPEGTEAGSDAEAPASSMHGNAAGL